MVIQTLTSVVYDITTHAWAAASVVIKYYLIVVAAQLYAQTGLTQEDFSEKILEDSRLVLTGLVVTGIILYAASFKPSPFVRVFSELIALGYLAFLFWRY